LKYLAYILLIGVFIRHDTSRWISDLTGVRQAVIFYIQGGFWEATLGAVVWFLLKEPSPYRDMAVMGCIFEISEGLQIGICRMFAEGGHGNVCDYWSGLPVGATLTALYAVNICYKSPFDMLKLPMILIPLIASAEVAYLVHPLAGGVVLAVCIALRSARGRAL